MFSFLFVLFVFPYAYNVYSIFACFRRTQLELYICLFQTHTIRTVYICLFQTHTMRNLAVFVLLLAMVGLNTAYWIDGM